MTTRGRVHNPKKRPNPLREASSLSVPPLLSDGKKAIQAKSLGPAMKHYHPLHRHQAGSIIRPPLLLRRRSRMEEIEPVRSGPGILRRLKVEKKTRYRARCTVAKRVYPDA